MRRFLFTTLPSALPANFLPHRIARQLTTTAAVVGPAGSTRRSKSRDVKARSAPDAGRAAGHGPPAPTEAELELQALEAALARHRDLYYNKQEAEISDAAFDGLKRRYTELAARLRGVAPEEVALPVGAPLPRSTGLRKLAHRVPMLSLAAVNSREEVAAWLAKTLAKLPAAAAAAAPGRRAAGGAYGWVVEPKVDGLAVRVLYNRTADGTYVLAEAATRGDGAVGEDVTHNALRGGIAGLVHTFSASPRAAGAAAAGGGPTPSPGPDWIEVRGEVFMRTADLQQLNAEQAAAGGSPFANARNAASGALRLLDSAECRRRRLSFVAYSALAPPAAATGAGGGGSGDGEAAPLHASHWRSLQWLQAAGFAVSPDNALCGGPEEAMAAAEAWMARRETLGYDADGVVLKLDDTAQYGTLGTAGSDPRWAVAWKFPVGEAVTRLAGVELAVGRQGQITPVALLEPVSLGGVTIRRASLHNVGRAAALGLHLGDAVVLRRSGDVIPQVMRVLPELRPPGAAAWRPPSACPACGGRLTLVAAGGADAGDQLVCENRSCEARGERALLHFATVCLKGSNVAGGAVPPLMEAGLLRSVPDWYTLDQPHAQEALAALPAFGPARRASLAAALASSRSMPASLLLRGLSIRLVGEAASRQLGRAFPSLRQLGAASREEIVAVAGVGPAVAASVAEWFARPASVELLRRLHEAGVQCVEGGNTQATPQEGAAAAPTPPAEAATSARAARGSARAGAGAAGGAAAAASPPAAAAAAAAVGAGAGSGGGGGRGPLAGLEGLTVCVTGTLEGPDGRGMTRSEMQELLERCGAEFHSSVKGSTQVLVVGQGAGAGKPAAAARKGVRVLAEADFWRLYGGGGAGGAR